MPIALYENSGSYINEANRTKNMQDDKNGGKYLDTGNWTLLSITRKTDSRGRVNIGDDNRRHEIRVFVSDEDIEVEICKNYFILPCPTFHEVTKSRKKTDVGNPLTVQVNGDVWATIENKNKYVKIFVRK